MMKLFSLRASEETLSEAERLAKVLKLDKSLILRQALEKGLEKVRLEGAIKLFAEGKLTLSETANTAGISAGEMMDELRESGLNSKIELSELEDTFQNALKIIK